MKIFTKIFLSHFIIGLTSVLILSSVFYNSLRNALIQRTIDQLSSINILKKNQLENYFSRTQKNILFLTGRKKSSQETLLHSNYFFESSKLKSYTQEISDIEKLYDFDNITLLDKNLHTIHSSSTDTSFLNILREYNYIDTSLRNKINTFQIIDASAYNPSKNTLLIYAVPLFLENVNIVGFMVIKENFAKIQETLFVRTGMGSTGESYIIAKDSLMRSTSRFFPDKPPLSIQVKTDALQNAYNNTIDNNIIKDYRGSQVLSVHRLINQPNLSWVIVSEIDFNEAMKPINPLKDHFILITLSIIVLILLVTFFISNAISKPILYLKDLITSLSKGIIPNNFIHTSNDDEIGLITNATNELIEGMKRTTDFANEIGNGNFNTPYATLSKKDSLGFALISMRDRLRTLNANAVKLVREKGAALMEGQENERKRITRELHDGIGQLLTVVKLRLETMEGQDDLKEEIRLLINDVIAEVRRISYNVMPSALVDFGLEAALKDLSGNIKKHSGLLIDFTYVKEQKKALNFDISITIFRIVQESLNNIIKHAKASKVSLYIVESEDNLYLLLKDDGIGFNKDTIATKRGFGLTSMKERAQLLNGELEIQSLSGKGTIIEVNIPINEQKISHE